MKAKTKKRPCHWQKMLVIIFLILAFSLFLAALIINFSWNPGQPKVTKESTEINLLLGEEDVTIDYESDLLVMPDVSLTATATDVAVLPEISEVEQKDDEDVISRPNVPVPADLRTVKQYSAVISVVDEQGFKIINQDAFERRNSQVFPASKDWVIIDLDEKNKVFRVFCHRGFTITDCSGGGVTRLKSGDFCARSVEKDTKNTLSLTCSRSN